MNKKFTIIFQMVLSLFVLLLMLAQPSCLLHAIAEPGPTADSDWKYPEHDPGNSAQNDGNAPASSDMLWKFEVGRTRNTTNPIIADDEVYISSTPGSFNVYSLDLRTGRIRWNYTDLTGNYMTWTEQNIFAGPECVYVPITGIPKNQEKPLLVALDRSDGTKRWEIPLGTYQPIITDHGLVIMNFTSWKNNDAIYEIRLYDPNNGGLIKVIKDVQGVPMYNGTHFFLYTMTSVEELDLATGEVVWARSSFVNIQRAMIMDNVIIVRLITQTVALDASTGNTILDLTADHPISEVWCFNHKWVVTYELHGLDVVQISHMNNDTIAWSYQFNQLTQGLPAPPAIIGDTLALGFIEHAENSRDYTYNLTAFNISNGEVRWNGRYPVPLDPYLPSPPIYSSIAAVNGLILFSTGNELYAIGNDTYITENQAPTVKLLSPRGWPPIRASGTLMITGQAIDPDPKDSILTVKIEVVRRNDNEEMLNEYLDFSSIGSTRNITWGLDTTLLPNLQSEDLDDSYIVHIHAYDAHGGVGRDGEGGGNFSVYNTKTGPSHPQPVLAPEEKIDRDGAIDISVNHTINFTAPVYPDFTVNGTTYSWQFGDGATSSEKDPLHSYSQAGRYALVLTLNNGQRAISFNSSVVVKKSGDPPSRPAVPHNVPTLTGISLSMVVVIGLVAFANTEVGMYGMFPLVMPLYTRIKKDEVLDHYTRGRIMGYLQANPGENFQSIKEFLDLNNGNLAYHLKVMEREGFIKSVRSGIYKHFYPMGTKVKNPISLQEEILAVLRRNPGINQKKVAERVNNTPTNVRRILHRLNQAKLIKLVRDGHSVKCYLSDEVFSSDEGWANVEERK